MSSITFEKSENDSDPLLANEASESSDIEEDKNNVINGHANGNSERKDTSTSYGSVKNVKSSFKRQKSLSRTQSSFYEDAREMRPGSIPQSMVVATVIGVVCGLAAYLYYVALFFLLEYVWHTLPESLGFTSVSWIPIVGFSMAILVGLSVVLTGEPGDLAYTVKCVHEKAYVSMDHVLPMVLSSQFSILGGGSLGPEAPLVAICAALGGFVSRRIFKQTHRNVIRKHTLMGMAGALAAFFGVPLGGSLFALEINSRFGVEYFEHVVESIFCGEVTLAVFRAASGLPIEPIWNITELKLENATPMMVCVGAGIGLLGAGVASIFAIFHFKVVDIFGSLDLLDNKKAVWRALLGAIFIVGIGMFIPQTLFWGEFEFQQIASLAPTSELEHIYPPQGLIGFEMQTMGACLLVALFKMIAISFTVAGGYRGGFIFPFFAAGAAFGRALCFVFPSLPPQLACLCFAAGINVAITRTSLATTLILAYLAGEPCAISAVLAASLVSLFTTSYMPFIKTQIVRSDIDDSLWFTMEEHANDEWEREMQHHQQKNPRDKPPSSEDSS